MPTDERLKCFLLGTEVGDALEDLQEQTEDLLEQAAIATHGPEEMAVDSCLSNTAGDLIDMLTGPAASDCEFPDAEHRVNLGVLRELRSGRVKRRDAQDIRAKVDLLTMYFAARANRTALEG